jgi:hypothetical protein
VGGIGPSTATTSALHSLAAQRVSRHGQFLDPPPMPVGVRSPRRDAYALNVHAGCAAPSTSCPSRPRGPGNFALAACVIGSTHALVDDMIANERISSLVGGGNTATMRLASDRRADCAACRALHAIHAVRRRTLTYPPPFPSGFAGGSHLLGSAGGAAASAPLRRPAREDLDTVSRGWRLPNSRPRPASLLELPRFKVLVPISTAASSVSSDDLAPSPDPPGEGLRTVAAPIAPEGLPLFIIAHPVLHFRVIGAALLGTSGGASAPSS